MTPEPLGTPLTWLAEAVGSDEVATPFLAADLDVVAANIAAMASRFPTAERRLRPHVKSHKCSAVVRLQLDAGACGVTCATADEVHAMVEAGIDDVLLANVVVDPVQLRSVIRSAERARVSITVDSARAARLASDAASKGGVTLGAFIEFDVGMRRNGVRSIDDGLRLADTIAALPGLELCGIQAYEGHLVAIEDPETRRLRTRQALVPALDFADQLGRRGIEVVIGGGSSATYDAVPEVQEVQAGTYVFMDATYARIVSEFRPALAMIATVVTARRTGEVVLNVGSKSLALDWGVPQWILGPAEYGYTAEEHLVVRVLDGRLPRVGERVPVLPAHACTTIAMNGRILGCRDGRVELTWTTDGREQPAWR